MTKSKGILNKNADSYFYNRPGFREKMSATLKGKLSGEKNPAWKGGNSRGYFQNQYNPLRASLVQSCFLCGTTKKLLIHHVDENYRNNVLSNLIIVCKSCHNKIHKTGTILVISKGKKKFIKPKALNPFGKKR